jgi:ABC-type nitrate/sulfonate/bicarbonate transport system permease component
MQEKTLWDKMFDTLEVREDLRPSLRLILGMVPIVLILLFWHILTFGESAEERIISPLILPSPIEVILSFKKLWFQAELSRSIVASLKRVVCGFGMAVFVALPIGILMGSFTKIKALFQPLMVFGAYLPIPALVPLTMSLFGIDEMQKIMFLSIAFVVYLLPMFVKAIDEVDDVYLQTAYTLGASKLQTVWRVLLGISMPEIFHSMRLGFGVGWTYIILAEMVAAERGLGNIIIIAQRRGPREYIYLVLVIIVVLAYFTDKLWQKLEEVFFKYKLEK